MVNITSSPFMVNTADAMKTAIRSGMGVGVLPIYSAIDGLRDGSLVRVLPEYRLQELNLYAIYPSRQYRMPRSRPGSSTCATRCRRFSRRMRQT